MCSHYQTLKDAELLLKKFGVREKPAAIAEDREYPVEIDAGHVGRVRIFFLKQKAKRGKFSSWFWVAQRAEQV